MDRRLRTPRLAATRPDTGNGRLAPAAGDGGSLRRACQRRGRTVISRREFLGVAAAACAAQLVARSAVADTPPHAVRLDGSRAESVDVIVTWDGMICRSTVVNRGRTPVRIKEV